MKKNTNLVTLGIISGILAWIGFNKYKNAEKLKDIDVSPADRPFTFTGFGKNVVKCFVNLVIDNPSSLKINIDKLTVEAYYKGNYLGRVSPVKVILNPTAKSPISLPLEILVSKIVMMGKDVLTQKKFEILFRCFITFNVFDYELAIPYNITIDIKEQLNEYMKSSLFSKLFA